AQHEVNLTKLESRPSPERPWQYLFYLDHEGGLHEKHVDLALQELKQHAYAVRILGSYPASGAKSARPIDPLPTAAQEPAGVQPSAASVEKRPAKSQKQSSAYKLASRHHRDEDTIVQIGNVRVGGDAPFMMIAGPCSVESREQIVACAR